MVGARANRAFVGVVLALLTQCPLAEASDISPLMLVEKHAAVGKRLDEVNYKAGSRIDIAGFDLRELEHQGRAIDPVLMKGIRDAGQMRDKRFRALDARRAEIADRSRAVLPDNPFVVVFENLEETGPGESGWFGWRQARLTWPDGSTVEIPLESFQNATFWRRSCLTRTA